MNKWETTEGFLRSCPPQVNVNLTPDGRADSIQAHNGIQAHKDDGDAGGNGDGDGDGEDFFVTPAEAALDSR